MKKTALPLLAIFVGASALIPTLPGFATEGPKPSWIWAEDKSTTEPVYFRRQWTQRGPVQSATLTITVDDEYTVMLNGKNLGKDSRWQQAIAYDVTSRIANGDNVIAVQAKNGHGAAGLVAALEITNQDGSSRIILSDAEWFVSTTKKPGWLAPSVDLTDWAAASVIATLGDKPWGDPLVSAVAPKKAAELAAKQKGPAAAPEVLQEATVHPEGFVIEKLYDVPKETQGSWVSMAVDEEGRLYCSDQGDKGIFRITVGPEGAVEVEKVPAPISGAQGLLWHRGALYAGVNGGTPSSGFMKVMDFSGDGKLDTVWVLREMQGRGEHGVHAVVPSPDGESLYLFAGNMTQVPEPERFSVPENFGEDQLLPSMPDARGHAKSIRAPGGWITKTDLDGSTYNFFAAGFRNQYDGAFNAHGELFSYDSDMEWDLGAPWYRPTRIYHVTSAAEFGWRTGSGKFPQWFPDVLPPALEVGPGSPTGVVSGAGAKFPAKYQNALYAFDWTYGTMYALHQKATGASYEVTKEEFVTGVPLYLTDGVVSPDGNLYFAVGGRNTDSALYRVRYTGDEPTAAAPAAPGEFAEARALRRQLETHHRESEGAVDAVWEHLGSEDRHIRYAARIALEHQPVEQWADRALAETDSEAALSALLALVRQGSESHLPDVLENLQLIFGSELSEMQQLSGLRVLNLALVRLGQGDAETLESLATLLSVRYPGSSDRLNRELAYTLTALGSPDVPAKTVPLLNQQSIASESVEIDPDLIARSGRYGAAVAQMKAASPERLQLWFAYVLRNAEAGWTPQLREQYFAWFSKARTFKGGLSFQGFVENIRQEALAKIESDEARLALAAISEQPARLIPEGFEDARAIQVGAKIGLKFDTDLITAEAGEKLAITFLNNDPTGIMHNLVIIDRGTADEVVAASMMVGPDSVANNFIPDIPAVLAATPQVAPSRKYTLYYEVPKETGDYHFICTYPGHSQIMQGIFRVE
ncbi:MAG: heme-binding protein [Verrucomicrobiota bacterium]